MILKAGTFTHTSYGPFLIKWREDSDGELRFTAAMDAGSEVLFEDIPYHKLAMAMVLIDRIVDQQLQNEEQND